MKVKTSDMIIAAVILLAVAGKPAFALISFVIRIMNQGQE
jgi:hypothetical protein